MEDCAMQDHYLCGACEEVLLYQLKYREGRGAMDKTIRRITDLKEQRMETYRYWRRRSAGERLSAVRDASIDACAFKGVRIDDELRSARHLVRIERPPR